jgi:hypothetical protein
MNYLSIVDTNTKFIPNISFLEEMFKVNVNIVKIIKDLKKRKKKVG